MNSYPIASRGVLCAVGALWLSACSWSWQPDDKPRALPASFNIDLIEIDSAGLLANRDGDPELALTLNNVSGRTLWVNVHFQTPGGHRDCVLGREMESQTSFLYICGQPALQAETAYPIRIAIFTDIEQTVPAETIETSLRFDPDDIQAAQGS